MSRASFGIAGTPRGNDKGTDTIGKRDTHMKNGFVKVAAAAPVIRVADAERTRV